MANYVIIGAGPAGLTSALQLVDRGHKPLVLEADGQVGGLSKTIERRGYRFDLGGHRFFTKTPRVQELWRAMLGDQLLRRPRLSRIYYRGKLFNYPLQIGNALGGLGPLTSAKIILSFLRGKLLPVRPETSFQDWVLEPVRQGAVLDLLQDLHGKSLGHSLRPSFQRTGRPGASGT